MYVDDGYLVSEYIAERVSIEWGTRIISIPKHLFTLVQETPMEIREMDLNWLRMELKNLEDSEYGMVEPDTHIHNTEVSLGGLTYARVIEIINGYTITFEDGQYAVNLTGANSNVADKVNVNQVSVRSANSAGMTSSPDIEYGSFNGYVSIDVTSPYSGTLFPTGTPRQPVNNIPDAKLIADYRGFDEFYIIGNIVIGAGDDIDDFTVRGQDPSKSTIQVETESLAYNCTFIDCMLTGVLDGNCTVKDSVVYNLDYVYGFIYNCLIAEVGEITLGGIVHAYFLNCYSGKGTVHGGGKPTINFGGDGAVLVMHNYNGDISLKNKTGVQAAMINLNAGSIEIQNSCMNGTIECQGTGNIEDYSADGCIVYAEDLMNSANIANAVLSADLTHYDTHGTLGEATVASYYNGHISLSSISPDAGVEYPIGTRNRPVNNVDDAITLCEKYNIRTIGIYGNFTFHDHDNITGFHIYTQSSGDAMITIAQGCNTTSTIFENVGITGQLNGRCTILDSLIMDLCGFIGYMNNCGLMGGTSLCIGNDTLKTVIQNCQSMGTDVSVPTIDMGSIGIGDIKVKEYSGAVILANKTAAQFTAMHFNSGNIIIKDTCVSGTLLFAGVGRIYTDDSGANCTIVADDLINKQYTADSVWGHATAIALRDDVTFIRGIEGGRWQIINNQMVFYAEDNSTEIARFDLLDAAGQGTEENVLQRVRH